MKTLNSLRFTLLAAATLSTHITVAGGPKPPPPPEPRSGMLVLSYPNADNWGLTVAPSGSIFAVGNTYTTWSQLVLGSSDSGNNWSVLDNYAPPGREAEFWGGLGGGIASDSVRNLYVSSFTYDAASYARAGWYVR